MTGLALAVDDAEPIWFRKASARLNIGRSTCTARIHESVDPENPELSIVYADVTLLGDEWGPTSPVEMRAQDIAHFDQMLNALIEARRRLDCVERRAIGPEENYEAL